MNRLGLLSGFIWGCVATVPALGFFGAPALAGLAVCPGIGLNFVRVVPYFAKCSKPFQILVSYVTLLVASGLFGFVVGLADMAFGRPGRIPLAVVVNGVTICVGILLASNFFIIGLFFWPASYFSFKMLAQKLVEKRG